MTLISLPSLCLLVFSLTRRPVCVCVCPAGRIPSRGSAGGPGVSGAAGLHAADRAGEEDDGLLPAGVPGGTHRSGAAGHGSV